MTAARLTVPDPYTTPFARWAPYMCEALAAYNVPSPPPGAGLDWQAWASFIYAVPEVIALGVANPRSYDDWRAWAATFLQVTQ